MDHSQAPRLSVHELWLHILGVVKERRLSPLVELKEIKGQLKGQAICTECLMLDDCIDKYPEVGCPALRFLKRMAEDME
ncbi:hypothetical protein ES702_03298 [subsurface metagenome]